MSRKDQAEQDENDLALFMTLMYRTTYNSNVPATVQTFCDMVCFGYTPERIAEIGMMARRNHLTDVTTWRGSTLNSNVGLSMHGQQKALLQLAQHFQWWDKNQAVQP